ncbi:hypothetical protein [Nocardioides terrigena]|uniref:hypothetical protein n=1 Tax=Nocardioides terrigena TaxID=424797 RepID=UPI000D321B99|nr:hypothetical protein [Nocardioides terrigena]
MSFSSTDSSASYAAEVARLLWPEPWEAPHVTRTRHRGDQPHRDAYLFPSERRPRLLVPADVPGSSSMLQRLGSGRGRAARPLRGLLERSVGTRAFALARWPMLRVPGDDLGADSIETHLAECFGTPVRVGIMLGTRRVNQKPVLQVFDLTGRLLGYTKVGHNELTAALVRREADALTTVGDLGPTSFRVPQLLHHGRWNGLEVLAISPLATDARNPVLPSSRHAAMRELAELTGLSGMSLAASSFWDRMRDVADELAREPLGQRLWPVVDDIEFRHGDALVRMGGWHGDWGHWNMGMGEGVLQVWDWERYDPTVPMGFDALHFAAQVIHPGERDARRREDAFLRSVPELLEQAGVDPRVHALTLRLYLLEISARYVEALRHGATPALQRRTAWALALLERTTNEHPAPSRGRS